MKQLFNILLALILTSSVAIAGDKPTPKRDLPPEPTKTTSATTVSTPNETTTPIELTKPEDAIDNAISAPLKSKPEDAKDVSTSEPASNDQAATTKKPAYKSKKSSRTYKKHGRRHHVHRRHPAPSVKQEEDTGSEK